MKLHLVRVVSLLEGINKMSFDLLKMAEDYDGLSSHLDDEVQSRETYVRAPFAWAGGKSESLRYLLKAIPHRKTDNEVCGGSGVFSLNRNSERTKLKIFNDRHSGITAFYRVLRNPLTVQQLIDRLKMTVHSREEFVWSRETWKNCEDDVERAARWYYSVRMSFAGMGRNFARSTSGVSQFPILIQNSLKLFPMIHQKVQGWQIENLDYLQCLKDYDSHDTVHYVDPPYQDTFHSVYEHRIDHTQLLDTVFNLKGYVAVSGYANELYDDSRWKWDERITWEVSVSCKSQAYTGNNHMKGREHQMSQRTRATEVLWIKH